MTARLLDGRPVASRMWRELSERVAVLVQATDRAPRLAILCFDLGGPSTIYAVSIARAARGVGLETVNVQPPDGRVAVVISPPASGRSTGIRASRASSSRSRSPTTWSSPRWWS